MRCKLCDSNSSVKGKYIDELKVMNCRNCGLVFIDMPVNEIMLKYLYNEDYFIKRKKYFFENIIVDPEKGQKNKNIGDFAEVLQLLQDLVPQHGRLLDVGCGIGIFLKMAQENNWHVTGIDISPFASRYAKEVFNLDVHEGSLTNLHFPPASFDVATMWDILEHLADPMTEIEEIGRILKKGGMLFLNTPNEESLLRVLAHLLYKMSFGSFRYPVRKLYHIYHLYYFNSSTLTKMLENTGFKILSMKKKPIPLVKVRGSRVEKAIVKTLSLFESLLKKEYELFIVAQKL